MIETLERLAWRLERVSRTLDRWELGMLLGLAESRKVWTPKPHPRTFTIREMTPSGIYST